MRPKSDHFLPLVTYQAMSTRWFVRQVKRSYSLLLHSHLVFGPLYEEAKDPAAYD